MILIFGLTVDFQDPAEKKLGMFYGFPNSAIPERTDYAPECYCSSVGEGMLNLQLIRVRLVDSWASVEKGPFYGNGL